MKHKKSVSIVFILLFTLLTLAGCRQVGLKGNDERLKETGYQKDEAMNKETSVEETIRVQTEEYQNPNNQDVKLYLDYINQKNGNSEATKDKIVFYDKEDLDLDGQQEAILVLGTKEEEPLFTFLTDIYVFKNENHEIKQIGDNLALDGYGVYEIKLINLQDSPKKYIYCGITNGNLKGFKIVELNNNELSEICYSASATGSGHDELMDFNQDGQYDGYVQIRQSYDVLYITRENTYVYKDHQFVLEHSWVDIPEYPSEPEEVVMQYITLSLMENEKSQEVTERLKEIYEKHTSYHTNASLLVPYSAVLNTILGFEEGFNIAIEDTGTDSKKATITYTDEEGSEYRYHLVLSMRDGKWRIDDIQRF